MGEKAFEVINMTDKELLTMAINAMENSYSPYSGCKVGAALLCENGKVLREQILKMPHFHLQFVLKELQFLKQSAKAKRIFLK